MLTVLYGLHILIGAMCNMSINSAYGGQPLEYKYRQMWNQRAIVIEFYFYLLPTSIFLSVLIKSLGGANAPCNYSILTAQSIFRRG